MAEVLTFPDRAAALRRLHEAVVEEAISSRAYYDARWSMDPTEASAVERWQAAKAAVVAAEDAIPKAHQALRQRRYGVGR